MPYMNLLLTANTSNFLSEKMFAILYLGLAFYFVISAIIAKGSLFDMSQMKEENIPDVKRVTRLLLFASSALLLAAGLIDLLTDWFSEGSKIAWLNTVLGVLAIIPLFLVVPLTRKYQDPEKATKVAPPRSATRKNTVQSAEEEVSSEFKSTSTEYPRTAENVDDGSAERKFF